MRTVRTWLLLLAAIAMTMPLGAQENNAPESHWQSTDAAQTTASTINWSRAAGSEADAAQEELSQLALVSDGGVFGQQPTPTPAQSGEAQGNSATEQPSTQLSGAPESASEKNQREKAEAQVKEQEQQRVLGVVPSFNVSYRSDAVSLTGWQKIHLAFRSSVDPVTFGVAFVVAGYREALDDVSGLPWGVKGYGERVGVAYLDTFDGNMIGNGLLPALLHQDPRYFRLGHGSVRHRLLYAASTAFICKHDNTGKWEPNYSNVLGNVASGALSTLYYPDSNSGIGLTLSNGMIQTAEGAFGSIFQEFWPDISRRILHKDPTHGLDAQAHEADQKAADGR